MNFLRNPLHLNLGFMLQQPVGASRVFSYDYGPLILDADLKLESLQGSSEITRTPQGLVVHTRLKTTLQSECGRCLTPILLPLQSDFTDLYVFPRVDHSTEDLVLPEDGKVDLGPIARQQLLLEVPINAVCKADCQGLCSTCGSNLNEKDCGHEADPIDPRLASLRSLLEDQ